MQHVKNIETLSEAQNRQLQLVLDDDDRADSDKGTETPARQSSSVTASKRPKKKKQWTRQPHVTICAAKKAAASQQEVAVSADVVNHVFERDPRNYGEAMKSKKRDEWQKAMREEQDALKRNEVWCLTLRSSNSNVLHSKWVFKTKTTADKDLKRHKARFLR
uniref:Reverse transcriptase Ty1/copia-type domain-containing protein n=1 Tax=Peronospora matthiolae TaxID=2874970 RepID=A0AAV1ULA2_9STRA